ncbi:MAG TPA: antibiotic biosynthesis monooxygenase [Alphaproteobacteria bacterium]|nr:antibiotic biosynthesis monooxygenase [Alphaproteobacteria bacterium]HBC55163.1 antibiotic biosynthesis monooxygenase [Alphaproteobacteria bacterium]HBF97064.1 antibiotic biosynthesis monooxygenase [Alphaproteobacteria bacterium]
MLVISGIFRIAPECRDRAFALARDMARASRAEDGCHAYSFYADIEDENVLRIFEEWVSDEALAAHFRTPHMKTFQTGMADLKILSRDVTKYEIAQASAL